MYKILVVDDYVDHLETLKMMLESAKFEVITESDPKKVVKIAETEQPEVIMSDINMPGINGLELARLLKANEKVKDIIILLFSSADQPGEMFRKALEAGANDYIGMPADKDEIISRISVCVERQRYIDGLKKAEEKLRENEERFNQVADNAEEFIWEVDTNGLYTYASPAVGKILGYKPEELTGKKHFYDFFAPDVREELKKAVFEVFARKVSFKHFNNPNLHKNGKTVILETSGGPIMDKDGNLLGYCGADKDITERKQMERELIQSEKMAGIGQLAAGVAHEFNNLLNIIGGRAEYARGIKDEREIKESLDTIIKSSDRGADIVRGLLKFAGRETTKKQLVDMKTVLEETIDLVKKDLEMSSIEIVKEYSSVPKTVMNIGQIKQVFLNIILNAQKAMPKGGALTIKLERSENFLGITFHNTGREIPGEDISMLFTPFLRFRTGAGKRSYGLGLSISHGIIESHGGTIEAASEKGKGTFFIIKLPIVKKGITQRVEETKDIIASAKEKIKVKKGKLYAILVVDDEEDTCILLKKVLEKEGYMVNTARNGETAVKLCENKHFDLIYLDLVMPKMDGTVVFKKIRKIDPEAEIVLMTGKLIEDKVAGMYIDKGAAGFIRKPVHIKEFVKNTKVFLPGKDAKGDAHLY